MSNSADIAFVLGLYLQHYRSRLFCPLSRTFDWFLSQGQSKKFSALSFFCVSKRLSNFSCFTKAVDRRIERLSAAFYVGQSVRSHILSVCYNCWYIFVIILYCFCYSKSLFLVLPCRSM